MESRRLCRPAEILLVEDNPADARLAMEAFSGSQVPIRLCVARNGIEAIEVLRGRGRFTGASRPDLILLDLNLPGKHGAEVLAEIKSDSDLKRIPVIVMTTSRANRDVCLAYDLNANCYIAKPFELDQFLRVVRSIEDFWLSTVTLPPSEARLTGG